MALEKDISQEMVLLLLPRMFEGLGEDLTRRFVKTGIWGLWKIWGSLEKGEIVVGLRRKR